MAVSKWNCRDHEILIGRRGWASLAATIRGILHEPCRTGGEPLFELIERVVLGGPDEYGRQEIECRSKHAWPGDRRSPGGVSRLELTSFRDRFQPWSIEAPRSARGNEKEPGRCRE